MKHCEDCIHDEVCGMWAVDSGIPFVNADTCVHYKAKDDVAEVRHGKWKEHFAYDSWHYDCPFCDDGYATKEKDKTPPNFCQNCGAKMDGKGDKDGE